MARLEYADPERGDAALRELADTVRAQRGGRLLNLYAMLLNSPPIAEGWLHLGTAVRFEANLDGASRELAICLVARLTGADYEWQGHRPLALAEGVSEQQVADLDQWRDSRAYDPRQRAVLAYADALTRQADADDATFAAVREHFDTRQTVELTATISYYNMVARFLRALRVDPEPGH